MENETNETNETNESNETSKPNKPDWRDHADLAELVSLITGEGYEPMPVSDRMRFASTIGHMAPDLRGRALEDADLWSGLDGRPLFSRPIEEGVERAHVALPSGGDGRRPAADRDASGQTADGV